VKTALARMVREGAVTDERRAAVAAGYQESIVRSLTERTLEVAEELGRYPVLVVGGVARNRRLRELLSERAERLGISVRFPDPKLCTDNAAMVAAAGVYKLSVAGPDGEGVDVDANLPLRDW
jgi:N6-L-threonylcarbamoyladenine synthase